MKKTLILTLACVFSAVILTGCKSVNTNDGANAILFKSQVEYDTQVDVGDKAVSGEAQMNVLFGIFAWGVSEYADDAFSSATASPFSLVPTPNTLVKQAATYNACEKNNADTLLGAKYKIETEDYFVFKKVKCTATGYPGVIKGVTIKK